MSESMYDVRPLFAVSHWKLTYQGKCWMHVVVKIIITKKYGKENAKYSDNSNFGMMSICFRLRVCCVMNVRLIVVIFPLNVHTSRQFWILSTQEVFYQLNEHFNGNRYYSRWFNSIFLKSNLSCWIIYIQMDSTILFEYLSQEQLLASIALFSSAIFLKDI